MEYVKKIDFAKGTDELRKIILENPTLPIVVLTDYKIVDEGSFSYAIKDVLRVKGRYYEAEKIIDNKTDLEKMLDDTLCYEEWTNDLSDEEYKQAVKAKMAEYESLWTKCICIYSKA